MYICIYIGNFLYTRHAIKGKGDYLPDWILFSSICFTINRLVSRNLSTQFAKQVSSLREKRVDGVPVTHLSQHWMVKLWIWALILAFEMESMINEELEMVRLGAYLCLLPFKEFCQLFLNKLFREMPLIKKWVIPELFRRTCCPPFYVVATG